MPATLQNHLISIWLATGGMRFTNAYASSSTCTPSKYGDLDRYISMEEIEKCEDLQGTAPLLIDTAQNDKFLKMLKATRVFKPGVVGKWHLGLRRTGDVDLESGKSVPGPNQVGFDYSIIWAAHRIEFLRYISKMEKCGRFFGILMIRLK